MTTASDRNLIERIAGKDPAAVKDLYARHHVRLYRFILRFTDDEAGAEDVMNEVFLEIWQHAARYEGRSSVSTWLLAIARNKAISAGRKRRDSPLDARLACGIADPDDTPEITAQKRDKSALLRDCLTELSVEHREIIDLVYYHEKSIREASEIIGIPENTVKTRMFYARKQLSALLRNRGIDRGWP